MKKIRTFMTGNYKLLFFSFIWLALQMVLVFYKAPVGFISDEFLYKRIADSIFDMQPVVSFHYPVLYPLLISPGLLFQNYFYEAMLILNILFKLLGLAIICKLLIRETDKNRAFCILVLIGFSPIYFLYSRVLMAENLACPLLIINILYHESYRKKLLNDNTSTFQKYMLTIIAALLSLALFWTKYLMLITLPVFCLYWSYVYFSQRLFSWKKVKAFLNTGIVYTVTVLICILGYAFCYSVRTNLPFTLKLITESMGFSSGSGPSNNGYALLADAKWFISYILYAFLGVLPIIVGMIVTTRWESIKKNRSIIILCFALNLALLYVSARHSTYAAYNEGGKMMNLCGRYVAYATPILAICWMRTCNTFNVPDAQHFVRLERTGGGQNQNLSNRNNKQIIKKLILILTSSILCWISYELLYVFSPGVSQSSSWLTGIRAADNAGFTNLGIGLCLIYFVGFIIICFTNYKCSIATITILMCIHSFAAIITCEQYHTRDFAYSVMTKQLFQRHQDDEVAILCTETLDFTYLSGNRLYYKNGTELDGVSVMSIADMDQPLYFAGDEYKYIIALTSDRINKNIYIKNKDLYEGNIEQNKVFLNWDTSRFMESSVTVDISIQKDNMIRLSCNGDTGTVFICGNYILPVKAEGNKCVVIVDKNCLTEDTVYIYNTYDLTVGKVLVK